MLDTSSTLRCHGRRNASHKLYLTDLQRTPRTALQDVVCEGLFGWVRAHGHDVGASLLGAQDVTASRQALAAKCCFLQARI